MRRLPPYVSGSQNNFVKNEPTFVSKDDGRKFKKTAAGVNEANNINFICKNCFLQKKR